MQQFDAIRPYRDEEVPSAIRRLLKDPEFLSLVAGFKAPRLFRLMPAPVRLAVHRWLRREFGAIQTIDALQSQLSGYVQQLITDSTSSVTQTGLEKLDPNKPYLFLSNHRDIVFDPMVVNFLLFQNKLETARIAIGDNLLENRLFAELMRLNKSFIVRRNMTSARDMRDAYLTLSSFIWHCLVERNSVWIAQREGRAKSGIDRTDPAIIKMFYMSHKKAGLGFSEAMNNLNIVPVSISYEFDPCDGPKARELEIRARTGTYNKGPTEDTDQIVQGIAGFKGRVHVHFGAAITDSPDSAMELADVVDREIHGNYHLHASNLAAYGMLQRQGDSHGDEARKKVPADYLAGSLENNPQHKAAQTALRQRLEQHDPSLRPYILAMYANPVIQAMAARTDTRHSG